jgi:hypothetical protein
MFIEVINEDVAFLERQYEQRSSRLQELSLSKPDSNELAHGTTVQRTHRPFILLPFHHPSDPDPITHHHHHNPSHANVTPYHTCCR